MEKETARPTPLLLELDLGIVLKALAKIGSGHCSDLEAMAKPPYDPLREVSLKHLTCTQNSEPFI